MKMRLQKRRTGFQARSNIVTGLGTPFYLFVLLTATAMACKVPVFRYALDRWPGSDYVLKMDGDHKIGSANLKLGRLGQAEKLLRRAIKADEAFAPAWNNLGVVLMEIRFLLDQQQSSTKYFFSYLLYIQIANTMTERINAEFQMQH